MSKGMRLECSFCGAHSTTGSIGELCIMCGRGTLRPLGETPQRVGAGAGGASG